MRRDIGILRDIVKYCDIVNEAVEMFGSDEEDFLDNKVYQTSTAFSILQIGELVKRLSPELRDEFGDVTGGKSQACATCSRTSTTTSSRNCSGRRSPRRSLRSEKHAWRSSMSSNPGTRTSESH